MAKVLTKTQLLMALPDEDLEVVCSSDEDLDGEPTAVPLTDKPTVVPLTDEPTAVPLKKKRKVSKRVKKHRKVLAVVSEVGPETLEVLKHVGGTPSKTLQPIKVVYIPQRGHEIYQFRSLADNTCFGEVQGKWAVHWLQVAQLFVAGATKEDVLVLSQHRLQKLLRHRQPSQYRPSQCLAKTRKPGQQLLRHLRTSQRQCELCRRL